MFLTYVTTPPSQDSEIRSSGVAFVPIMCTVILALTMFSGSLLEYMFGKFYLFNTVFSWQIKGSS